jgi:hypothetical protein
LVAALIAAALLPVSGYCENLRFVFLADSRGSSNTDLINTTVLNAINSQILALSPRPSFVVFGGDQAYRGCVVSGTSSTYSFQAFKDAMAPLTNTGISLYTVVGNHELTTSEDNGASYRHDNQIQYQLAFSSNPVNGPAGYEHLAYSFTSPGGDAFFAVMDPYYLTADDFSPNNTGTFAGPQLTWLATQVAQTKATHKFLFNHGPYYYVVAPAKEGGLPPDITYTDLWSILDNNRFDLYCCGHIHLFSRKTIDSSIAPNPPIIPGMQWHNNVVQLLTGTCGSPIESGPFIEDPTQWNVHYAPDTYYFSVVDISGSKVTVNTYAGDTGAYTVIDSFTINKGAVPATSLLLLE